MRFSVFLDVGKRSCEVLHGLSSKDMSTVLYMFLFGGAILDGDSTFVLAGLGRWSVY